MTKKQKPHDHTISWERARAVFGDPDPPRHVWERQFDYNDDDLKRIAATPYREIDRRDLWNYFHDLAYAELQPELFAYLFPVCLMEWHETLMRNESCSRGDAEFHYGMVQGQVFRKMLNLKQQIAVGEFFRDSFLERLDAEPVDIQPSTMADPFQWIGRFNSLGFIIPRIDTIWEPWWEAATRGRAIAILKYCSGLSSFEGENKLFGFEPVHERARSWRVGPNLWENDSWVRGVGWLDANVEFLRKVLSFDYVLQKAKHAAERLLNEPEHELAEREVAEIVNNRELVESRVAELPKLLADNGNTTGGWCI